MTNLRSNKTRTIVFLAFLILSGIFLRLWISRFRITFIDYDPFYHARMAEYIHNHAFLPKWDPQELGGVPYYYSPGFHILMAVSQNIFTTLNSLKIGSYLNVFFGVLGILFLYLLAREEFNSQIAIIAAILFAVSPALVFRTSLWARPNGLNVLLPIFAVYAFSKLRRTVDLKWYLLALIVSLFYVISHSFVILILVLIWIAMFSERIRRSMLAPSSILLITGIVGILYYSRFFPYLNFSMGYTVEYKPLISISLNDITVSKLLALDPYYWGSYLSFYHLSIGFPLIIYGIYLMYKRNQRFFLILTLFSLGSVFFKLNVTLAFLFLFCIAMALSISEIYKWRRYIMGREVEVGWSMAITLMLIFIVGSIFLTGKMRDANIIGNADIVREVLIDVPLNLDNTIIANDPDFGHEIAYYSDANTFNSDLTDVKPWKENMDVYESLKNPNFTVSQAVEIMRENNIDHLLLVYDNETQIFPFAKEKLSPYFYIINEKRIENKTAKLFRINT